MTILNPDLPPRPAPVAPVPGALANVIDPTPTVPTPTVSLEEFEQEFEQEPEAPKKKRPKSRRLNIDAIGVLIFTVVIVFSLMAASFAASAVAIYEVSVHTGIGAEWRWVFPVFIDLAIFAYTISLFIFKRRGESTIRTILGLLLFSLISIGANIAHTVDYWNGDIASFQAWVGIVLAAAAPIGVLLASEEIARLAFTAPDDEE